MAAADEKLCIAHRTLHFVGVIRSVLDVGDARAPAIGTAFVHGKRARDFLGRLFHHRIHRFADEHAILQQILAPAAIAADLDFLDHGARKFGEAQQGA